MGVRSEFRVRCEFGGRQRTSIDLERGRLTRAGVTAGVLGDVGALVLMRSSMNLAKSSGTGFLKLTFGRLETISQIRRVSRVGVAGNGSSDLSADQGSLTKGQSSKINCYELVLVGGRRYMYRDRCRYRHRYRW